MTTRNEQLVKEARAHAGLMIHAGDFDAEKGARFIYSLATALSECRERERELREALVIARVYIPEHLIASFDADLDSLAAKRPGFFPIAQLPSEASERSGTRPFYRNDGAPGRRHYV